MPEETRVAVYAPVSGPGCRIHTLYLVLIFLILQGMPEETRVAVQRENEGGVMKRVVRDRGIFPAGAAIETHDVTGR